jgi:hypothetical protein
MITIVGIFAQASASDVPIWKNDVTDMAIPSTPAQGIVHGVEFKVEKAYFSLPRMGVLHLSQGKDYFADQEFKIVTFINIEEIVKGKTIIVKSGDEGNLPQIVLSYKVQGENAPETEMFMKGYSMKLEFAQATGDKIEGEIYLCLPDGKKSFVAGSFEAEIKQ